MPIVAYQDILSAFGCPGYQPSERMNGLLDGISIAKRFPVLMSWALELLDCDPPILDLVKPAERTAINELKLALSTKSVKTVCNSIPYIPDGTVVINKPGMLLQTKTLPQDFESWPQCVAMLNAKLLEHGNERIFLNSLGYDIGSGEGPAIKAELILTAGISPEEFTLCVQPNTNNPIEPWEMAIFFHLLLNRYPLDIVGTTLRGVYLWTKAGATLDVDSLNRDLKLINENTHEIRLFDTQQQPIVLFANR